jgi:hypothetical protein
VHVRAHRLVIALSVAAVTGALTFTGGVASASVTKGSPQPELKPFTVAAKDFSGGGSVAILPSGTLLAAFDLPTTDNRGETKICILPRSGRACLSSSPIIIPPHGASNSTTGIPQVLVLSAKDVDVLIDDVTSGDLLYSSTDAGRSFGSSPIVVGNTSGPVVGVDESALIGKNLVFGQTQGSSGAQVVSVSVDSPVAPTTAATASSVEAEGIGIGSSKGGALVADSTFTPSVIVSYAKAGKNFDATSSYAKVGTYSNESLIGMSGNVLLTQSSTGSFPVRLRVFNGTKFGVAHTVPHGYSPGPEEYVVDRDPSGEIHVFTILSSTGYELQEQSTSNGAHWSSRRTLASAETSGTVDGALDATGSGIILGTNAEGGIAKAYPVLASQSVSFALSKSTVKEGAKIKATGKARPIKKGRTITLERLEHGLWHSVRTTKESKTGAFSFTIKTKSVGSFTYRAVGSDTAGFVEFGYSAGRTLHVKKK